MKLLVLSSPPADEETETRGGYDKLGDSSSVPEEGGRAEVRTQGPNHPDCPSP